MKKAFAIALALILCLSIFIFTACNDKYIGIEGTIIDKEYKEPHTTTYFIKSGNIMIPMKMHHPAEWYLRVEYNIDGKKKTTSYSVTEEEYNSYKIGDMYIYNGGAGQ